MPSPFERIIQQNRVYDEPLGIPGAPPLCTHFCVRTTPAGTLWKNFEALLSVLKLDGEHVKQVQHLPAQQKDGQQNHHDGHQSPEAEAATRRLESSRSEGENVEWGKAEHDRP